MCLHGYCAFACSTRRVLNLTFVCVIRFRKAASAMAEHKAKHGHIAWETFQMKLWLTLCLTT